MVCWQVDALAGDQPSDGPVVAVEVEAEADPLRKRGQSAQEEDQAETGRGGGDDQRDRVASTHSSGQGGVHRGTSHDRRVQGVRRERAMWSEGYAAIGRLGPWRLVLCKWSSVQGPRSPGAGSPAIIGTVERLLDLLMPPACGGCGREGDLVCLDCLRHLGARLEADPRWPIGLPADLPAGLGQLEWCAPFTGPTRRALHELKYAGNRRLAGPLGRLLAERWRRAGMRWRRPGPGSGPRRAAPPTRLRPGRPPGRAHRRCARPAVRRGAPARRANGRHARAGP